MLKTLAINEISCIIFGREEFNMHICITGIVKPLKLGQHKLIYFD